MFRYIFIFLLFFSSCKEKNDTQIDQSDLQDSSTISSMDSSPDSASLSDSSNFTDSDSSQISDSTKLSNLTNEKGPSFFEGIFITNLSSKTLRDCRYPDSVYWVIDETNKLKGQYDKMFNENSVYNSVYVKVKGKIENTVNTSRSETYPRSIRVSEVVAMQRKDPSNTCVPYDFWAFGNDNSWSLQISKFENLIEFIIPSEKKTYYFFYNEPTEEDGLIIYKSHNLVQRYNIEIRLKKESCTDAKTGKKYEYAIYIDLSDEKVYYGCAIKGKK